MISCSRVFHKKVTKDFIGFLTNHQGLASQPETLILFGFFVFSIRRFVGEIIHFDCPSSLPFSNLSRQTVLVREVQRPAMAAK
jgi:hypothetical protein